MIEQRRVLAIITARSGSKGLPDKNIRQFCGKPLLAWPILCAASVAAVDRCVLSTDSQAYADSVSDYPVDVPFLRPAALAADDTPSADVIVHLLDQLEAAGDVFDYLLLLEPTSPLTDATDIDAALRQLVQHSAVADAIVAVKQLDAEHPEYSLLLEDSGRLRPYLRESFGAPKRRQELPQVFAFSGSFYISSVAAFKEHKSFYHARTLGYPLPGWKAREIDTLEDFVCAEALMTHRNLFETSE